jgi:hypothetical protein
MKQDERLQELADMKLALAVLSVQLMLWLLDGACSLAPADPADRQEFRTTSCARQ